MSNRINYTLAFTADTNKAKQQLSDLQSQINNLVNRVAINQFGLGFTKEIQEASAAAVQLKTQLQSATSVNTGKLDLTKFNHSLKQSGQTLQTYQTQLMKLGPEGQKAFKNLAIAITNSERPIFTMNENLKKLGETFANTIRWQISSSALMAFTGTIQSAYNYAKSLNKSLNDIRIVTGQSTDEMAQFADKANKAAKSLSASTLAYTKASLIYYQQGLSNEEVAARTNTTIKMSNVTGESADQVSSYMTAIWNNFAKGSQNLDYFADVITALGAATAASSEEIANGLEKFASIGETVGLSYEYATAALTTIIDKTRQSEDVVGNALKTIFARIQGLQQGETQDDGVTLNKYSKALENVGIQVLESNGELKEMDAILDELGERWTTLGNAEKVALAQTVGGVRQYSQLISLMDNWESFKQNVNIAETSSGSLQSQQDIYAESWEAASKRVKAAMEGIFNELLSDEFFITLTNGFADLLDIIKKVTQALGGVQGILTGLATAFIGLYEDKLAKIFTGIGLKISTLFGKNKQELDDLQTKAVNLLSQNLTGENAEVFRLRTSSMQEYIDAIKNANSEERKMIDSIVEQHELILNNVAISQERAKGANRAFQSEFGGRHSSVAIDLIAQEAARETLLEVTTAEDADASIEQMTARGQFNTTSYELAEKLRQALASQELIGEGFTPQWDNFNIENINSMLKSYENMTKEDRGTQLRGIIGEDGLNTLDTFIQKIKELKNAREELKKLEEEKSNKQPNEDVSKLDKQIKQQRIKVELAERGVKINNDNVTDVLQTRVDMAAYNVGEIFTPEQIRRIEEIAYSSAQVPISMSNAKKSAEGLSQIFKKLKQETDEFSKKLTSGLRGLTSVASGISSLMSLKDTWNMESDIGVFERILKTTTTIGFAVPMVMNGVITLGKAFAENADNVKGFGSAIDVLGGRLKTFITNPYVLAITAIVGAVAALGYAIYQESTRTERALKEANKQLEESKKYADETKKAYEGLKNSIDSLESAKKTLAGMKEGTLEWKEAVLKLNQQILDLIKIYPELSKYLTNEGGILSIDEEGLDKVISNQLKAQQAAQQAYLSDTINQKKASVENANKKNIQRIVYKEQENEKFNNTSTIYTAQKENANNPLTIDEATLKKVAESLQYKENGKDLDFDAMGLSEKTESFKKALQDNIEMLEGLRATSDNLNSELQNLNSSLASSWLESHNMGGELNDFYATGMSKYMDSFREKFSNDINKLTDKQTRENYAKYILGPNANREEINSYVQKLIDDKTDVKTLKETLLSEAINYASKEAVDNSVGVIDAYKNTQGYDTLRNIIASGGDESSFNALSENEAENFRQLLFGDNGELKEEFREIFDDADIFGENFSNTLSEKFKEANKKAYAEESEKNQEELYQKALDKAAGALGVDESAFSAYAEKIEEENEALKNNKDAIIAATTASIKWNDGVEKVSEALEKNKDNLSELNKGTWDYYESLGEVTKAASEMLGIEVSAEYVEEHLDDLQKATEGNEEAIRNLQKTAAVDWARDFADGLRDVVENYTDLEGKTQTFDGGDWANSFTSAIDSVAEHLGGLDTSITLEADTNQALDSIVDLTNKALEAGQMTEAQMRSMFSSMGYSPEVDYVEVPQTTEISGEFKIGDDTPIPYSSTATTKIKVPRIQDKNNDGNIDFIKISPPSSLGGSKPKSSSSSGGSQKEKKNISDEIERYHVENKQLEQIKNNLDEISKAKDKAFGKKRLDLLRDENKELNKQIDAQKTLLKEVEKNLSKDKGALAAYGAQFDKNGIVTNYEALYQQQINKFNNSARGEADEEAFNTFKEIFEQYEETLNLWQETKTALSDDIDKEFENRIETIQVELELKVDKAESNIEYIEYLLENLENKAFDAAEAISLLGENVENLLDKSNAYRQNIQDLLENEGVSKENIQEILNGQMSAEDMVNLGLSAETIEEIINSQKGLMETNRELLRSQKEIWENIGKVAEETIKGFDEQSEAISHASNVLEHYKNIVELVGQENLNVTDAMMNAAADANINNAMAALTNSKMQLETLQEQKAIIESNLTIKDLTESERELLKAQLEGINEEIRNAEDTMLSDWENVLKQASQEFDNAVSRTIKAFEKAMSGTFGSFERLQDAFNKQKELDDMYLDDYKKIYELSKLTRDIEKSIDSTDNIAGKQILLDLQKEINNLEAQGVKLSEYDVKNLRAKYDLRLAEIALEEAQNAKSQVRMTRDTEGNWSYVYTADENKMAEAQQNYEDKLYAMQELNAQYIENLESLIIQSHQKMTQEINSLDKAILGDRYDDEVQRITNFYLSQADIYNSQFNNALGNATDTYSFWEEYNIRTGYSISANEDWVNSFEETQLSILTGFETLEEYHQAFVDAVGSPDEEGSLLGGLASAYDDWSVRVNVAMEEIGTSTETFGEKFSQVVNNVNIKSDEAIEKSKELKDEYVSNMEDAVDAVEDFHNDTGRFIDGEIEKNNRLITSVRDLINAYRDLSYEDKNKNTTPLPNEEGATYQNGANGGGDGGNYNGGGTVLNPATTLVKDSEEYKKGKEKGQSDSANHLPYSIPSEWANHVSYKQGYKDGYKILGGGRGLNSHMQMYDTGGYTGAWGTSGRLAVLHEKELVLNKKDTENILKSVDMVRHISTLIEARAAFNAANFSYAANIGHVERDISQNITINAEFPDATDRNEIQAAFENLFNRASQFANRKNKSWSN